MGKMSKEVPKPLSFIWKVSHAFVLVMDIFPSLCSSFRTPFYFCHSLVIFPFYFSQILVITEELLSLLDHATIAPSICSYLSWSVHKIRLVYK